MNPVNISKVIESLVLSVQKFELFKELRQVLSGMVGRNLDDSFLDELVTVLGYGEWDLTVGNRMLYGKPKQALVRLFGKNGIEEAKPLRLVVGNYWQPFSLEEFDKLNAVLIVNSKKSQEALTPGGRRLLEEKIERWNKALEYLQELEQEEYDSDSVLWHPFFDSIHGEDDD